MRRKSRRRIRKGRRFTITVVATITVAIVLKSKFLTNLRTNAVSNAQSVL
jgi:hypothetical protein